MEGRTGVSEVECADKRKNGNFHLSKTLPEQNGWPHFLLSLYFISSARCTTNQGACSTWLSGLILNLFPLLSFLQSLPGDINLRIGQGRDTFCAQEREARKMHEFQALSKFPVLLITGRRTVIAEHKFQVLEKDPGKHSNRRKRK